MEISGWPLYTKSELITKLGRYRGPRPNTTVGKKTPDADDTMRREFSTTLRISDFQFLAKIRKDCIFRFIAGTLELGEERRRRLSRALWLADNGYVEKLKWKVYEIHDQPFQAPVKEMKVQINLGGIGVRMQKTNNQSDELTGLNFNSIFGGKK